MATGDIGAALADTLALSCIGNIVEGDVAHVQDEWFVVAYHENGTTDTVLESFSVDDCGNIPASVQSTVTISTASTAVPRIQSITKPGGIFAVFYLSTAGACGDHTLATYSIDGCGNISACPIDTLVISSTSPGGRVQFEPTQGAGIYALFHSSSGDGVKLSTIDIDACGNIGASLIDTLVITSQGYSNAWPAMVWTGQGDFYAWPEVGSGADGFVHTVDIDSCGNIAAAITDSLEFDTSNGQEASIGSNDNGTLFLYYEGPSSGGDVTTVTVDACGMLTLGDDIAAGGISGETTALLRIDEQGDKNIFLGAANSGFRSWSFDGCNNITEIDTLASILEINDHPALTFLPGSSNIVVGCGFKVSTTDFFVFSLDVATNIDPAADTSDPHGGNVGKLLGIFCG